MLRIALALALLLATVPAASAAEPHPCESIPFEPACPIAYTVEEQSRKLVDEAGAAVGSPVLGQPGVFAVNVTEQVVCAGPENVPCRAMDGRPVTGGVFDFCRSEPVVPGLVPLAIWTAGQTADQAVAAGTTLAFAGTPLEGERLCEEHWSTLRALATLP